MCILVVFCQVLFIKYDSQVIGSGSSIREDSDDERFEIGQQYAWEWSLKINSINEDDSGIYFCKVGNTIIKQFEIIVRGKLRIYIDSFYESDENENEKERKRFKTCMTFLKFHHESATTSAA